MEQVIRAPFRTGSAKKGGFCSLYSKGEEIFNGVSHIVGGALGLFALVFGVWLAYPVAINVVAMAIFAVSVIVLYTMSALYHFLPDGRAKGVFRIFDHCTIFLLIAGTYTPYCLIALGGSTAGTVILCVEWTCACAGIVMNCVAMNNRAVKVISMIFYVVMGWAIAVAFEQLLASVSPLCFWLLLGGGIAYTVGIIFYALGKKIKYFHSVWHLFDVFGTALQLASILMLL